MPQDPVVALLIALLTTPGSDFYLSTLLGSSTNPKLEPYQTSSLDLGSQSLPVGSIDITLTDVSIAGISNCQIAKDGSGNPQIQVDGTTVTFQAIRPNTEAPPPNVPAALQLTANLVITPTNLPALPHGTAAATITQATLNGTFTATSTDGTPATATIAFSSLSLSAPLGTNIVITVNVSSIFNALVEGILAEASVQQSLLDRINSTLNSPAVLAGISQQATSAARAAAGQALG